MSEPNVPPPPPAAPAGDSNRTLMLVLSYLGLLALIPLLVEKNDREVQWHAKHGLVQCALWIVVSIVFAILSMVPFLGCITSIIWIFVPLVAMPTAPSAGDRGDGASGGSGTKAFVSGAPSGLVLCHFRLNWLSNHWKMAAFFVK